MTVSNGTITAVKVGNATITATASGFSAECTVSVFFDCPAVDLGLSVKWGIHNSSASPLYGMTKYTADVEGLATGNSIFMPVAGYYDGSDLLLSGEKGYYWSSSISMDEPRPDCAYNTLFSSVFYNSLDYVYRYYGQSVRAVTDY